MMNGKKARTLNKILDTVCVFAFFMPVTLVVYGYIGRECVRYTVKGMRERLSK
jgi:hypothetical protein